MALAGWIIYPYRRPEDRPMIASEKSIIINRSVDDVWKFISTVENVGLWDPEFDEFKSTTEGSTQLGSVVTYRRTFVGQKQRGTLCVSEYEPGRVLTLQVSEQGITGQIRYIFEPVMGGTRLTSASQGEVTGWWVLLKPYLTYLLDKDSMIDLVKIKQLLEAQF
jgi:hypothetical protein